MLSALSDFAQADRYLFMNKISEPGLGREWPKMRWEEVERLILSDVVYYRLLQEDYAELKRQANHLTQGCIERFTRALARLFVFANLRDTARNGEVRHRLARAASRQICSLANGERCIL